LLLLCRFALFLFVFFTHRWQYLSVMIVI
jgi:hypothetical protein